MTAAHPQLAGLDPDERMRTLAWLLAVLEVGMVDVHQKAKRLGLLHQRGLLQGLPVDGPD